MNVLGLIGGIIGVYANIHSNIIDNRRLIDDTREELNKFMVRTEQWQSSQKNYDENVRKFILDQNKQIQDGQREVVKILVDLAKK